MENYLTGKINWDEFIDGNDERKSAGMTAIKNTKKDYGSICTTWDFRANQEYFSPEDLLKFMKLNCKKYVFQLEKGKETGYLHWQGRFSLMAKTIKSSVVKSLGREPNYLEPTSKENHKDLFFYVMKEDTRVGETYMDPYHKKALGIDEFYMPRQYRDKTLYPYQQTIRDSAEHFDDRMIDLIVDPTGGVGKSTIAAICEILDHAIDLPIVNDHKDLIHSMCDTCMDRQTRNPKLVFLDMPRALDKRSLNGFYTAIEQIKKGKLYDLRYHTKTYWIDSPRIWVFTNEEPDENLLSRDRWRIWRVNKQTKILEKYDSQTTASFSYRVNKTKAKA